MCSADVLSSVLGARTKYMYHVHSCRHTSYFYDYIMIDFGIFVIPRELKNTTTNSYRACPEEPL